MDEHVVQSLLQFVLQFVFVEQLVEQLELEVPLVEQDVVLQLLAKTAVLAANESSKPMLRNEVLSLFIYSISLNPLHHRHTCHDAYRCCIECAMCIDIANYHVDRAYRHAPCSLRVIRRQLRRKNLVKSFLKINSFRKSLIRTCENFTSTKQILSRIVQ
jgi:hypothetical protein